MIADLTGTISRELAAAGLRPDPTRFDYLCARTNHFGELEYRRLLKSIGSVLEPKAKLAIRLLGWGHVMTEFAVAHAGLPGEPDLRVLSLGAISNLIVSAYDGLLDSGADPERILLRSDLTGDTSNGGTGDPFITQLVALYYARLSELPHPHDRVLKILRNAIVRMYDAEIATIRSRDFALSAWRRKSALPFVIMGLPVWLTIPVVAARQYREHLNWLYRLGQFFGWIDDAADLVADCAAGRPNYFSSASDASSAPRIARQGARILESWNSHALDGHDAGILRQTFLAVTWSWLGANKTGTLDR